MVAKRILYKTNILLTTSQLFLENTSREDENRNTDKPISYRYEVISRYVRYARNRGI